VIDLKKGIHLNNIYDDEIHLVGCVADLFDEKLMFTMDTAHELTADYFQKFADSDKVACVIELMGFKPAANVDKQPKGLSFIEMEWRITVLSPSELYNRQCGAKLIEVIRSVCALNVDGCKNRYQLIQDVHEGHKPKFDTSLTAIHASFRSVGLVN